MPPDSAAVSLRGGQAGIRRIRARLFTSDRCDRRSRFSSAIEA